MTITILPTTGANFVTTHLCALVSCCEGDSRIAIDIDISAAPVDGANVPVSMYDLF